MDILNGVMVIISTPHIDAKKIFFEYKNLSDTVLIEKSNDGGDTWTVLDEVSKFNRWFEYYEQESGSFEFRISLMSGEAVIDQTFGNRTVSFRDNMLIYSVDAWFDEWNMLYTVDPTISYDETWKRYYGDRGDHFLPEYYPPLYAFLLKISIISLFLNNSKIASATCASFFLGNKI